MATSNYYTNAYAGVPDQYGYNTKGSVVSLQQQLNSKGANLALDGTWGPLTDAAYKQYMGGSALTGTGAGATPLSSSAYSASAYPGPAFDVGNYQSLIGAYQPTSPAPSYNYSPAALERLAFTPRSEADLQSEAYGSVNPTYDRYYQQLEQGLGRNTMISQQQQADIERQKNDALAQTGVQYEQQRAALEANALARGVSRGSHLTDTLANSQMNENAAMQRIQENWQYEHNQISDNIARLNEDYNNAKSQGERERMEQISAQISKLRETDRQLGLQIQQYNADQGYREATINSQMQQMQYESQLAAWKSQQDMYSQGLGAALNLYGMDRDWASQQAGYAQQTAMLEREYALQNDLAKLKASASGGGSSSSSINDLLKLLGSGTTTSKSIPIQSGNWMVNSGVNASGMSDNDYRLYQLALASQKK